MARRADMKRIVAASGFSCEQAFPCKCVVHLFIPQFNSTLATKCASCLPRVQMNGLALATAQISFLSTETIDLSHLVRPIEGPLADSILSSQNMARYAIYECGYCRVVIPAVA